VPVNNREEIIGYVKHKIPDAEKVWSGEDATGNLYVSFEDGRGDKYKITAKDLVEDQWNDVVDGIHEYLRARAVLSYYRRNTL
jgi:hypothetical protein